MPPKANGANRPLKTAGLVVVALPVLFISYCCIAIYSHMHPIAKFCKSVPTSVTQDEFVALAKHAGFESVPLKGGKILVPNNGPPYFRNGCEGSFDHGRLVNKAEIDAA